MSASVVIVDDDAPFRSLARELLEAGGLRVTGEADGAVSGRLQVAALDPDVVLLDVHLADGDGCELAAALKADGFRSVVVLISSRPASSFGPRLARCGARGFIPKEGLSAGAVAALLA